MSCDGSCSVIQACPDGLVTFPVAPAHRIIAAPTFAPIGPGLDSPSVQIEWPQALRVLYLSAVALGGSAAALSDLALRIEYAQDQGSPFSVNNSAAFVPFSHLMGYDGSRVFAFAAGNPRALVDTTSKWNLIVRNLSTGTTYTPHVAFGVLCGWPTSCAK